MKELALTNIASMEAKTARLKALNDELQEVCKHMEYMLTATEGREVSALEQTIFSLLTDRADSLGMLTGAFVAYYK